jgi:hypothetical protein
MTKIAATEPKARVDARIRPALRDAVTAIVHEGLSITEAAQRVGYARESLSKALSKPHVVALKAAVKRAWLGSETERAWLTVVNLSNSAASEDVRLKAARILLEAAGELGDHDADRKGPASLVQININHANVVGQGDGPLPGVIEIVRTRTSETDTYGVIERPSVPNFTAE